MSLNLLKNNGADLAQQSLHYQTQLMRLFNVLCGAMTAILMVTFFLVNQEADFWRQPQNRLWFFVFLALYYASLLAHYVYSFRARHAWFLLSNSLLSNALLTAMGVFIVDGHYWNILALIVFCSALLSVLVLQFRDGIIFGLALSVFLLLSYAFIIYLDYPHYWWQALKAQVRLVEVILIATGEGILVILIGHLSSQARENQLDAKINVSKANRLSALNDSIIENISIGLIVVDQEGNILALNNRARMIFNTDHYESAPSRLIVLSSPLMQRFGRWKEMRLHNTSPLEVREYSYTVQFNYLFGQDGLVLIQLENVIENMNRIRETRLTSLGKLTASIAHEIKNPLSSVQGAAELLAEQIEDKDLKFLTEKIYRNSERIGSIVGNILDVFNHGSSNNEMILINQFIRYVVDEARMNDELSNIFIRCDLKESEGYSVYFDPSHLRQVLDNLMLNAVKHSNNEHVVIDIVSSRGLGDRTLYIDVIDNGQGVRLSDENRIFEPFFSSRNSSGLGLYIVREFCLANQAQIHYVRRPGGGACFRITAECYLDEQDESIPMGE